MVLCSKRKEQGELYLGECAKGWETKLSLLESHCHSSFDWKVVVCVIL